jgi:hypothetical protein
MSSIILSVDNKGYRTPAWNNMKHRPPTCPPQPDTTSGAPKAKLTFTWRCDTKQRLFWGEQETCLFWFPSLPLFGLLEQAEPLSMDWEMGKGQAGPTTSPDCYGYSKAIWEPQWPGLDLAWQLPGRARPHAKLLSATLSGLSLCLPRETGPKSSSGL